MISAFNDGEDGYFGLLKPMPGAVEALQSAHAAGREMTIITACSINPKVIAQREQNLLDVFGDIFRDIHAVDLKASSAICCRVFKIWPGLRTKPKTPCLAPKSAINLTSSDRATTKSTRAMSLTRC